MYYILCLGKNELWYPLLYLSVLLSSLLISSAQPPPPYSSDQCPGEGGDKSSTSRHIEHEAAAGLVVFDEFQIKSNSTHVTFTWTQPTMKGNLADEPVFLYCLYYEIRQEPGEQPHTTKVQHAVRADKTIAVYKLNTGKKVETIHGSLDACFHSNGESNYTLLCIKAAVTDYSADHRILAPTHRVTPSHTAGGRTHSPAGVEPPADVGPRGPVDIEPRGPLVNGSGSSYIPSGPESNATAILSCSPVTNGAVSCSECPCKILKCTQYTDPRFKGNFLCYCDNSNDCQYCESSTDCHHTKVKVKGKKVHTTGGHLTKDANVHLSLASLVIICVLVASALIFLVGIILYRRHARSKKRHAANFWTIQVQQPRPAALTGQSAATLEPSIEFSANFKDDARLINADFNSSRLQFADEENPYRSLTAAT